MMELCQWMGDGIGNGNENGDVRGRTREVGVYKLWLLFFLGGDHPSSFSKFPLRTKVAK